MSFIIPRYEIKASAIANDDGSEVWCLYTPSYDSGECIGEFSTVGAACDFALMRGYGPIQIELI